MYWTVTATSGTTISGTTIVTTSGTSYFNWGGYGYITPKVDKLPTTIKDVCDTLPIHKHKDAQVVFDFQEANNKDQILTSVVKTLLTKIDFKSSSLYVPYKDLVTDVQARSLAILTIVDKLIAWLKIYHYGELNLMYIYEVNGYVAFKLGRFTKPSTRERVLKHMGYIR